MREIFVSMKTAAGVCIQHPTKPGYVLSCSRGLVPPLNWALVGGKGDEGELPILTALRECREETGVHLTALDLEPNPYCAPFDGREVTFWLVRPTRKLPFKRITREGWVAWQPIAKVLRYHAFAAYNEAMFRHFNIWSE